MIKLKNCKDRFLYKIDSRNLSYGVFNLAANGFIGIREKFGDRYLFTEYHWDTGAPYGTVRPIKMLCALPDDIICDDDLGTLDGLTGRAIADEFIRDGEGKIVKHLRYFTDVTPREIIPDDQEIRGVVIANKALFNWLEAMEKEYEGV